MQDEEQEWDPAAADFMAQHSRILQTEAGNAAFVSSERHGYGDTNDVGSEISLLPLNNKDINAERLFLNLDWPCSSVPVAAEIMVGQSRVSGRGYYRGHSGWNPRSELDFTGRTGTMAELGVREGGLVTTPSFPARTDRDSRFGGV